MRDCFHNSLRNVSVCLFVVAQSAAALQSL